MEFQRYLSHEQAQDKSLNVQKRKHEVPVFSTEPTNKQYNSKYETINVDVHTVMSPWEAGCIILMNSFIQEY